MNAPTPPTAASAERLPADLLEDLSRHGGARTFPANAILINEGDTADSLYIVLSGLVKVYSQSDDGREIVLAEMGPGEYLGELSLDGEKRSVSVKTMESTRCCVIQGGDLRQFLKEHPDFSWHMTRKLIHMVRRLTDQVKSLALQDVYGRVVRVLMELSEPKGELRVMRHKLTQQDIADRVGSSREMVNRIMKELTTGGYVGFDDAKQMIIKKKLPAAW